MNCHVFTTAIAVIMAATSIACAETFVASNPKIYEGKTVGNGQCVAFVQEAAKAPQTAMWKAGKPVRGNNIPLGTAIATFKDGKYPNESMGNHAAIYAGQDKDGIFVWDQWKGQPVHRRHIKFNQGKGSPSNDGDAFSVIERK